MSVRFTELRIAGFKSFADPVSLTLLPGLTAIIGPNGCGKSNIVEAFRWIMGESSAKALRSGDSDDLIFAGTTARTERNFAEVSVKLENASGLAAAPHDTDDVLEITRTAKRGVGSSYQINGKAARAHDVSQIFADLSLGGRSLAIVSQNRIGNLIEARPVDRRTLLESAAGISGLHLRRKDAELKLRQSETNLQRADDHLRQLCERQEALRIQAEAARIYREAVSAIRSLEAHLYTIRLSRAEQIVRDNQIAAEQALDAITNSELERAHLTADLETQTAAISRQEAQSEAGRNEIENLRISLEKARLEAAQSNATLAHIAVQHAALLEERERLMERLKTVREEQAVHRASLDDLEKRKMLRSEESGILADERDAAAETRRICRLELAEHETQLYALKAEADMQARRRLAAENLLTSIESEHRNCKAQKEREIESMPDRDTISILESEIRKASEEIRHRDEEQKKLLEGVNVAERECEELSRKIFELSKHVSVKHAEKERLVSREDYLKRQIETLETRHAELLSNLLEDSAFTEMHNRLEAAISASSQAKNHARETSLSLADAREAMTAHQHERQSRAQQRTFIEKRLNETEVSLAQLTDQLREIHEKRSVRDAPGTSAELIAQAKRAVQKTTNQLQSAQTAVTAQREALKKLQNQTTADEETTRALEMKLVHYQAEQNGLSAPDDKETSKNAILESLMVPENYATAFGAAFGHGWDAQLDAPDARQSWETLPISGPSVFPESIRPLSKIVKAPSALSLFLDATGVVASDAQGAALHASLKPGQTLVSLSGAVWRWDGYRHAGGTLSEAARHLRRRARHNALSKLIFETGSHLASATQRRDDRLKSRDQASHHLTELEDVSSRTQGALLQLQKHLLELETTAQRDATHLEALEIRAEEIGRQIAAATSSRAELSKELSALPHEAEDESRQARAIQVYEDLSQRSSAATTDLERAIAEENTARVTLERAKSLHDAAIARSESLTENLQILRDEGADIQRRLPDCDATEESTALSHLKTVYELALQRKLDLQSRLNEVTNHLKQAREALTAQQAEIRKLQDRLLASRATVATLDERLHSLAQQLHAARADLESLPDVADLSTEIASVKRAQDLLHTAERNLHEVEQRKNANDAALKETSIFIDAAQARWADQERQILVLVADLDRINARQAELNRNEEDIEETKLESEPACLRLQSALKDAEQQYTEARLGLDAARTALDQLRDRIRQAEIARADAVVARKMALEKIDQGAANRARLLDSPLPESDGDLDCAPPPTDISERAEQSLQRALQTAIQNRDALGPVNLLAEKEFREVGDEISHLKVSIDEILTAISKLTEKISQLNSESRRRLRATFQEMDAQFQKLFTGIFGGGRANLALVGGDDPLEAGLEIYAQPPGKKLATLSLLSGGEQALTALSLLFATFVGKPTPICILDEVDAPLDDANTVRLCTLIREMTSRHNVQFLIVTHQQITMAYMDQLFGVTMQERGVSRLLSVDLSQAISVAEMTKDR